jgi:hypothetical protein
MAKAALFEPIRVRNSNLSNRIVIAPMCQYSAENGCMTDWHLIHLGHLSLSEAALLTIEATAILPEGRCRCRCWGGRMGYCSRSEAGIDNLDPRSKFGATMWITRGYTLPAPQSAPSVPAGLA